MKQLQNNFTTPEQSKRLLELGVPADSADCCYEFFRGTTDPTYPFFLDCKFSEYHDVMDDEGLVTQPCWSVGRLIEILTITYYKSIDWLSFSSEQPIGNFYNTAITLNIIMPTPTFLPC